LEKIASDVSEFHKKFGLDTAELSAPGVIQPADLQAMRINFLFEELDEYATSLGYFLGAVENGRMTYIKDLEAPATSDADLENALDALVDLTYVAAGNGLYHGFTPEIQGIAWDRVQAANMSKIRVEKSGDSKRGSTFDVKKPAGWVAPSYADILFPNKQ
jgi:predicted HAD superfamily Cof-like phosphohydrolase